MRVTLGLVLLLFVPGFCRSQAIAPEKPDYGLSVDSEFMRSYKKTSSATQTRTFPMGISTVPICDAGTYLRSTTIVARPRRCVWNWRDSESSQLHGANLHSDRLKVEPIAMDSIFAPFLGNPGAPTPDRSITENSTFPLSSLPPSETVPCRHSCLLSNGTATIFSADSTSSEPHSPLPDFSMQINPYKWHTLDREFIRYSVLSVVATAADVATTARALENNNTRELDPLYGGHPTRARLYGITVPLQAFLLYTSYYDKRIAPRRTTWKTLLKISIIAHTAAATNNLIVLYGCSQ